MSTTATTSSGANNAANQTTQANAVASQAKQLMIVLQNGSYKVLSLGADVLPEYKLQPTRIHHCTIVHYRYSSFCVVIEIFVECLV
uniref:Uncharacterized protein n=1 Tax=Caenorhabditis japonica TaxID=281687 RepID=A0A8R1EQW3_CAEJA